MRLDRTVTLALSKIPPSWRVPGSHRARLPILMYHSISEEPESTPAYYQTVTNPSRFAAQMQVLKDAGYVGVTMAEGLRWLQTAPGDGPRPVAITFDDGFRDFFLSAVPALRRHGFRATMYLATGFVQDRRQQFMNRDCLTWDEVTGLYSEGFEFGSHTVTHRRLVDLQWQEIRSELVESKMAIERHLKTDVTAFAYPYAFPQERTGFVRRFAAMLTETGYRSCVTTKIGRARPGDDRLSLRRLPVNSCDDDRLLLAKLEGAYDWLAIAQAAVRKAKQFAGGANASGSSRSSSS